MAAVTALVLGGTQSVSRTIMGLMTPEARTGEFFGFFNLSGKAFSMLGPIMFTEILKRTGSANWAILSLLVFFVVGWAIIAPLEHRPRPARSPRGLGAAAVSSVEHCRAIGADSCMCARRCRDRLAAACAPL